jgi:hypothetical protein
MFRPIEWSAAACQTMSNIVSVAKEKVTHSDVPPLELSGGGASRAVESPLIFEGMRHEAVEVRGRFKGGGEMGSAVRFAAKGLRSGSRTGP